MCPECQNSMSSTPCGTGYELFHLMDNLQCRVCHWKPLKKVTFQPSILKVEYRLNHHCEFCQLNSYRFKHTHDFVTSLLKDFEPKDDSFLDMGRLWLNDDEIRPYDRYDYLRCNVCHHRVTEFEKMDIASLIKDTPDERVGRSRRECSQCFNMTWGTLLEKTYQTLPKCFACHRLVENREMHRRECCRVRGSKVIFHFDCSRNQIKCINCQSKCKIAFNISKSDPTLQDVKLLGKALKEND